MEWQDNSGKRCPVVLWSGKDGVFQFWRDTAGNSEHYEKVKGEVKEFKDNDYKEVDRMSFVVYGVAPFQATYEAFGKKVRGRMEYTKRVYTAFLSKVDIEGYKFNALIIVKGAAGSRVKQLLQKPQFRGVIIKYDGQSEKYRYEGSDYDTLIPSLSPGDKLKEVMSAPEGFKQLAEDLILAKKSYADSVIREGGDYSRGNATTQYGRSSSNTNRSGNEDEGVPF